MSKHYEFPGGVDILPGRNGDAVPSGGFRLVTIGGVPYSTTDGVTFTQVGGGGGGTVHTTAPLSGDGSVGTPVAISAATDSTPGSMSAADKTKLDGLQACTEDPWMQMVTSFVAGKVPTLVNPVFRSKCSTAFALELEVASVSGTGAASTTDATRAGGVIKLATGTTGNSFQIVRNSKALAGAGSNAVFVPNCRTSKWAVAARVAMDTPTAGCTYRILDMADEATGDQFLGVVGSTSVVNWTVTVGSGAATDTGTALPAALTFVSVVLIADGVNVSAWNLDTGVQIGTNIAQSTAITAAGHVYALALNTAASNKGVYFDDWAAVTELAI